MIDPIFSNNWKRIIEYNKKAIQEEISPKELEEIRIPLTPIKIGPELLRYFFKTFYPQFINDQQNVIDIIVSDDQQQLLKILLYQTEEAGVHTSFKKLENNIIKLKKYPLDKKNEFFNELQEEIFDEYKTRISHMRIFKNQAIEILNDYLRNLEDLAIDESFSHLLAILEELIVNKLVYIYPKPNIFNFIEEVSSLFNQTGFLSESFDLLMKVLPRFNIALVISSPEISYVLNIKKENNDSSKKNLNLKILNVEEFDIDLKGSSELEILKALSVELEVENIFLIKQKHIIKMMTNLFELEYPIDFSKLKLLMQKLLFGFRSYETNWFRYPQSFTYNPLLRWFIRLFGFNYNLRKLSHWEIPEFLFNTFSMNFGLKNKIVIILTDLSNNKNTNLKAIENPIRIGLSKAILLKTEDRKLTKFIPITHKLQEIKDLNLKEIRKTLMKDYGYIDLVLSVDQILVNEFIDNFLIKFNNFNIISKIKTLSKLKKDVYFNAYPPKPEILFIKNTWTLFIIKKLLPILIDRHLF